jgi:glycosyltransferase involved in cell wall biosynthesis
MACGCPVVAAEAGACPEISGGATLLADPDDPGDFAAKMYSVLTDSRLAADLSARGIERASEFNWPTTARKILNKLVEAMEQTSG